MRKTVDRKSNFNKFISLISKCRSLQNKKDMFIWFVATQIYLLANYRYLISFCDIQPMMSQNC